MLILGIETSCDDTAASVVSADDKEIRVLSNVISSQISVHAPYGGVVPNLAAREHEKNLPHVLAESLAKADRTMADIDRVAVTSGPGLIMSLVQGVKFANKLAEENHIPIIGINHIEGHIYSNWLSPHFKSEFPALCLIVSGGHTELILMRAHGQFEKIGVTLDDAAGECFDKIARILGLAYPGGPAISKLAATLFSPIPYTLPRPKMHDKTYDFSFAGLKTSALYLVKDLTSPPDAKKFAIRNIDRQYTIDEIRAPIAHEAQEAIVDVLISKTLRAAEEFRVKSILVAGGVSANTRLRERLPDAHFPSLEYTMDNAAMIAAVAYFSREETGDSAIDANANWEIV